MRYNCDSLLTLSSRLPIIDTSLEPFLAKLLFLHKEPMQDQFDPYPWPTLVVCHEPFLSMWVTLQGCPFRESNQKAMCEDLDSIASWSASELIILLPIVWTLDYVLSVFKFSINEDMLLFSNAGNFSSSRKIDLNKTLKFWANFVRGRGPIWKFLQMVWPSSGVQGFIWGARISKFYL